MLWNGRSGKFTFPLPGHAGNIWALDWSPRGNRLATAGDDGTIRVAAVTRVGPLPQLTLSAQESSRGGGFIGVAFSRDGRRLMGGDLGVDTVTLWDTDPAGDSELASAVGTADLTPDGRGVLVAAQGGLRLLDARTGELSVVLEPPRGPGTTARTWPSAPPASSSQSWSSEA